jgi:hypothetical protein
MAAVFAGGGVGTYVASVQQVEITIPSSGTSATATITSVNTSRSVIFWGGYTTSYASTFTAQALGRVELTNATTVTAYRLSSTSTLTIRATVVEFTSSMVASVQAGTIAIASGATSNTATISSVTTSRSAVFFLGQESNNTFTQVDRAFASLELTNATTVTARRNASSTNTVTVGYMVVEFQSAAVASVQPRAVTLTSANTSDTDTITSVTTGRTLLLYNGVTTGNVGLENFCYNLELTGATQITLRRTGTSTTTKTVYYTALEFASGVVSSLQRGTLAVASATSADATISSVSTSAAICHMPGFSTNATSMAERFASAKLQGATAVRGERGAAGTTTSTVGYEVIVFN